MEKCLLGFAAGVMTAASVWSLLLPAIESAASWGRLSFVPASLGFLLGFALLLMLERILPDPLPAPSGTGILIKEQLMIFYSVCTG